MREMTPEAKALFDALAPPGYIPSQLLVIFCWVDPDTGVDHWNWRAEVDNTVHNDVGLLEMAKLDMIETAKDEAGD